MIIVKIFGGLGNQMFQYAAGRALAIRHGTEVMLDLRAFRTYRLHKYSLSKFCIEAKTAPDPSFALAHRAKLEFVGRLPPGMLRSCYIEHPFGNHAGWDRVAPDAYIKGYFQSEYFFKEAAVRLRDEFRPGATHGAQNDVAAALVADCESVALHVRRGDYVSNKATLDIHGACSIGYYQAAVELLRRRLDKPRFFVFSNDFTWAREHLRLGDNAVLVDWNASAPELDLHLMSRCRHHVIANSTFSWWGAWLGEHPNQLVVAPNPWFESPASDDSGVLPSRWLRAGKNQASDAASRP